jgi:hypothetical protein
MTKEIVRWAIVELAGSFVMTFPTKESAECSSFYKDGCTIVKLTGQMPEPKKMKRVASYAYQYNKGGVFNANQLLTEDEAKHECEKYNVELILWPYGSVIEIEE